MPRYIDADALLKKKTTIRVTYHCQGADEWDDYEAVLVKDINNAPTISPDEVRGVGEWEDNYPILVELECLRCKNCNKLVQIGRYCANCGERKKGAEDSE